MGVLLAVGPLAVSHERLKKALSDLGLELKEGVARRHAHGGWNAKIHLPRSLSSHYLPGSTFIVQTGGSSALPALAELEAKGLGPGRPDGWGRLKATAIHRRRQVHRRQIKARGTAEPRRIVGA